MSYIGLVSEVSSHPDGVTWSHPSAPYDSPHSNTGCLEIYQGRQCDPERKKGGTVIDSGIGAWVTLLVS